MYSTSPGWGLARTGTWLMAVYIRRSPPTNPTHNNRCPNPRSPMRARQRSRKSTAEWIGSVAVSIGGMGSNSR